MSAQELETLRESHNTLRDDHHRLHTEHIALKGEVVAIRQNVDTVGRMIEDNRRTRDAQHLEVMTANANLAKKIATLDTAETKRDGMVQVGKYALAVLTALGILTTLLIAFIDWIRS